MLVQSQTSLVTQRTAKPTPNSSSPSQLPAQEQSWLGCGLEQLGLVLHGFIWESQYSLS